MQFNVRSILAGAAVAAGLALATPATANAQIGFVVQGTYGTDYEAIGVGGGINFGLGSLTAKHGIRAETTFDYFFADDTEFLTESFSTTIYEINGNVLYDLKSVKNLYLGAGINYAKIDVDYEGELGEFGAGDSEIGLNLIGGFKLGSGKSAPFVQARFALGGGEQLYLTGGIRF